MQIDHIYPNGGDSLDNLCLSCWNCNNYKRDITHIFDPIKIRTFHSIIQEFIFGVNILFGQTILLRLMV
ncbi:MAG: HNH endonuclease [Anaerolineae bacterium]|nr:HNH endonuclease [Anaerolineae bacterium]